MCACCLSRLHDNNHLHSIIITNSILIAWRTTTATTTSLCCNCVHCPSPASCILLVCSLMIERRIPDDELSPQTHTKRIKKNTTPNWLRASRRLRLSSRRGDNENRPSLQNDGLIGPLRGGRDGGLRGELIVLLFCYSNGLLSMQSEARVAYTELLQSIYLEVQDCTNELHLLHTVWLKTG